MGARIHARMHACTCRSAHASATCTRACFTLSTRINMYRYTRCVQPTPTPVIAKSPRSIVSLYVPPVALSRPPLLPSFSPSPSLSGPSCTYKRLHTNIPGITMGGMLIRESTRKFFHYLWILIFRTAALRLAAPARLSRSNLTFLRAGIF